jgi:hypothetical protein
LNIAARAASGDSHTRPRSNHFIVASGWRRCNWRSVGSSSSGSRARNAVGAFSITIVQ